jgi:molecular chaperone DnaJ
VNNNYYQILEVSSNASDLEIKKSYRKLVRKLHPDLLPQNATVEEKEIRAKKIVEINNAYEVLSNAQKRAQFDAGMDPLKNGGGQNYTNFNDIFSSFSDITEAFFGTSTMNNSFFNFNTNTQKTYAKSGSDVVVEHTVYEKDIKNNKKIEINYQKLIKCSHCDGRLAEPNTNIIRCPQCNGTGATTIIKNTIIGKFQTQTTCSKCYGTGEFIEKICQKCLGAGTEKHKFTQIVSVPNDLSDNMSFIFYNKGNVGIMGGKNGMLIIHIIFKKHRYSFFKK